MRPLAAHCHLGLGKFYRRTGDPAKAEDHLTVAAAMYREMGMSGWLPDPNGQRVRSFGERPPRARPAGQPCTTRELEGPP